MNFQLKHRGFDIPDSLKAAVAEKISRFDRVLPENAFVELELVDHPQHHAGMKDAEVVVDIPGQKQVVRFLASEVTFLAAVDLILDKLDDYVGQLRDKQSDYHYKGQSPKEWLADEMTKNEK